MVFPGPAFSSSLSPDFLREVGCSDFILANGTTSTLEPVGPSECSLGIRIGAKLSPGTVATISLAALKLDISVDDFNNSRDEDFEEEQELTFKKCPLSPRPRPLIVPPPSLPTIPSTMSSDMFKPAQPGCPLAGAGLMELKTPEYHNELQWQIVGDGSQILEVVLNPNDAVTAEPGTMVHMSSGLKPDVHLGGGCGQACTRSCCAGESFFRVKYQNNTETTQHIGLTPNFPAKIVPVNLAEFGGRITIKSRAFMCAHNCEPTFSYRFAGIGAGCCGGQGFILNDLSGDGMVFLNASGTVLMRKLEAGEELICDQSSVVAFQSTVNYAVRRAGGLLMCCCGGEGLFNSVLTGPGTVVLQSMPIEKIAAALVARGGNNGGGGGE
ncbi:hypothetical protein PTSG_10404 [Salpingoeca rosetta]|uniref:Uncharacterized protein n=1 Tax=Salpingoeca rosetta (strain ATCC 50818 / BSB-021) TaxID=946362 RepID=F2UR75_SALR5|nr:uncharacterized protein PTSG_10404 [Salpingoeca rosetta]EGD80130.1 hypothetical protein PTSG_10404 [Salpingoeca rosetta]|eukprot:XP_004988455.1 hypothetical protein PTSG_10404 [Salpingoeca rosetta]